MSGRLGQFDDFDFGGSYDFDFDVPTFDFADDFVDFDFDVPTLDVDTGFDTGDFPMWEDDYGVMWAQDYDGAWYNLETGEAWVEPSDYVPDPGVGYADSGDPYPPYLDDAGTAWYFDQNGEIVASMDASGNTTYFDGAGGVMEQTSADGSQTTAPVPQPVVTDPATGSSFSLPSLKDLTAFATAAAGIYRTVSAGGQAPIRTTAGGVQTRTNPQTGRIEYYNAQTRQWQASPPRTTGAPGMRPPGSPGAQLIPGVSNTTLAIGAGVVGLAFVLAAKRRR